MEGVEQVAFPRSIWADDDLERGEFYFEVFECFEAVYLDPGNHTLALPLSFALLPYTGSIS